MRFQAVLLILLLLLVLSVRFFFVFRSHTTLKEGEQIAFTTTLLTQPSIKNTTQTIAVLYQGQRLFLSLPLVPQFHYGDFVRISGTIHYKVLQTERIAMTVNLVRIEPAEQSSNIFSHLVSFPLSVISSFRSNVISFLQKSLPSTESALLLGIVYGIKQDLPKDLTLQLQNTGVMHIIAASGMNVTLVTGFVSGILLLFLKRQYALVITCFIIFFYAAVAGFAASILRASLMAVFFLGSQIIGRQQKGLVSLLLAGYCLLFFSPELLFDIGFQLSFSATCGLIVLKPQLDQLHWLQKSTFLSWIKEDLTTTLAAQLATLPILLFYFGTLSLWSIVVNCLIVWVIAPLMVVGGVASLLGILMPLLGTLVAYLALPLLLYIEFVIRIFSFFPVLSEIVFPWQFVIAYYGFLGSWIFLQKKNVSKDTVI